MKTGGKKGGRKLRGRLNNHHHSTYIHILLGSFLKFREEEGGGQMVDVMYCGTAEKQPVAGERVDGRRRGWGN